jgi:hypothetical protein
VSATDRGVAFAVAGVICLIGAATVAVQTDPGRWVWFWVCIGLAVACMGVALHLFLEPRREARAKKRRARAQIDAFHGLAQRRREERK